MPLPIPLRYCVILEHYRLRASDQGLVFDECASDSEHMAAPAKDTEKGFRRTCRTLAEDVIRPALVLGEGRKGKWTVLVEFEPDEEA